MSEFRVVGWCLRNINEHLQAERWPKLYSTRKLGQRWGAAADCADLTALHQRPPGQLTSSRQRAYHVVAAY